MKLIRQIGVPKVKFQRSSRFITFFTIFMVSMGMFTGCSFIGDGGSNTGGDETSETDWNDTAERIADAIIASDDRIVGVREVKPTMSGFASGMRVIIEVSSNEPLSAQTVTSILDAVWETSDRKPIDFELIAIVEGTKSEGVDVHEAATELVGTKGWIKAGNKGAAILSGSLRELMKDRV